MAEFTVEFSVHSADGSAYRVFIEGLRPRLQNPNTWSHQRPVLSAAQNPPTRWFDVILRTQSNAIRLRIRRDNLYLDGYRQENSTQWYEFNNEANTHLISGSTLLSYGGSYIDLEREAGSSRESTPLGQQALITAVNDLANLRAGPRSLMIIIQMFCEAIRFAEISTYITNNFITGRSPTTEIVTLENGWSALSRALLAVDQYPEGSFSRRLRQPNAMNINDVTRAIAVIGIILHSTVSRPPRAPRSLSTNDPLGRRLVEVFWVRIDNIDSEDPGHLYGTVTASDGLGTQTLYSRNTSNYETINPGAHALLTGPPRAISADGDFTIDLDLWDYDSLSPDDEVAKGRISWNSFDFSNSYDTAHIHQIRGTYGAASVNYVVLSDAAEALVEIVLINGDGEDPAHVYGNIAAKNNFGQLELFRKAQKEYVEVKPQQGIPLLRKAVAVPVNGELIVEAELYDYDSLSPDDEIAKGRATFTPEIDVSTSARITGQYGQIEVRVSWY